MRIEVHHFHHHDHGDTVPSWSKIMDRLETIMATLDEVLSEVTDESTRLDSIQALIDGIKKQLADALSGATLPAGVQAKVDAVFAGLTTNKGKIDTALNAGVPAPPPSPA